MEKQVLEIEPPKIVRLPKEIFHIVEERLDAVVESQRKITWTDKFKVERELHNLSNEHARRLSYWCKERKLSRTRKIIQAELMKRATGLYPDNFDEMIKTYRRNPEIWRLKIY